METATQQQREGAANPRRYYWIASAGFPVVLAPVLFLLPLQAIGSMPLQSVAGAVLAVVLLCAAYTDTRWRKIPNFLTYPAVLWGIGLNALATLFTFWPGGEHGEQLGQMLGPAGLLGSLAGFATLFLLVIAVFSMTGGGAGDVKLVAGIGALVGLQSGIDAVAIGFIFAAVIAMVYAIIKFGPWFMIVCITKMVGSFLLPLWVTAPDKEQKALLRLPIPLAPSIALGGLVVLFDVPFDEWLRGLLT